MSNIIKIFNNNAVLIHNEIGQEQIALGKGVGFGKKIGDEINAQLIEKTFSLNQHVFSANLMELLNDIPLEYFRLVNQLVEYANQQFHKPLSQNIYIALTDHLYHAILRIQQNQPIHNHLLFEIKRLYQAEFNIGLYAKQLIAKTLQIDINEDEVGFIALHIFNARTDTDNMADTYRTTQIIRDILNLVKYHFQQAINEESLHYSRFITHLQYFAMRLFSDEKNQHPDDLLYQHAQRAYPQAVQCVEKIANYLQTNYQQTIGDDERLYLIMHIQRILE